MRAGNPLLALASAAELPGLSLDNALRLVLVLRTDDADRYSRAAARWIGRYATETRGADLAELHLLLVALGAMRGPHHQAAAQTMRAVLQRRGHRELAAVIAAVCDD